MVYKKSGNNDFEILLHLWNKKTKKDFEEINTKAKLLLETRRSLTYPMLDLNFGR